MKLGIFLKIICVHLFVFVKQFSSSSFGQKNPAASRSKGNVECDVAVVGAGLGGLSAAAILSSRYNLKVHVYESHYRAGGCAHSFSMRSKEGTTYNFDAGPTILLGCSTAPYNPLRQVLNHLGASSSIDWIPYQSWGMWAPETGYLC